MSSYIELLKTRQVLRKGRTVAEMKELQFVVQKIEILHRMMDIKFSDQLIDVSDWIPPAARFATMNKAQAIGRMVRQ